MKPLTLPGSLGLGLLFAMLLAGCGEREQSLANKTVTEKPWQGAHNAYVAQGWTVGDQASWEAQVRLRGQYQNEYLKTN